MSCYTESEHLLNTCLCNSQPQALLCNFFLQLAKEAGNDVIGFVRETMNDASTEKRQKPALDPFGHVSLAVSQTLYQMMKCQKDVACQFWGVNAGIKLLRRRFGCRSSSIDQALSDTVYGFTVSVDACQFKRRDQLTPRELQPKNNYIAQPYPGPNPTLNLACV